MKPRHAALLPLFVLALAAGEAAAADASLRLGSGGVAAGGYGLRVRLLSETGAEYDDSVSAPWSHGIRAAGADLSAPYATDFRPGAAYVDYRWDRWTVSGGMRQDTDIAMRSFTMGASYGFSLSARRAVALSGSLNVGNQGVSFLRQSYGLPVAAAGSGLRDYGGRLSLTYTFDRSWFVQTTLGYTRLLSDPADATLPDRSITSFGASVGLPF